MAQGFDMIRIALLDNSFRSRASFLENVVLPLHYMEDFSLLGFTVHDFNKACKVLGEAGFSVTPRNVGAELALKNYKQIKEITHIFKANRIVSDFSDIADTLYQA